MKIVKADKVYVHEYNVTAIVEVGNSLYKCRNLGDINMGNNQLEYYYRALGKVDRVTDDYLDLNCDAITDYVIMED